MGEIIKKENSNKGLKSFLYDIGILNRNNFDLIDWKLFLTNDKKSTSPFPDLGGKLCVWFLWLVSDIIVFLGDRLVFY